LLQTGTVYIFAFIRRSGCYGISDRKKPLPRTARTYQGRSAKKVANRKKFQFFALLKDIPYPVESAFRALLRSSPECDKEFLLNRTTKR
jgi:hypothetical protein